MPTADVDQRVRRIIENLEMDVQELQHIGVISEEELHYSEFVDYPKAISIIKRIKLDIIKQLLAKGVVLDTGITMAKTQ